MQYPFTAFHLGSIPFFIYELMSRLAVMRLDGSPYLVTSVTSVNSPCVKKVLGVSPQFDVVAPSKCTWGSAVCGRARILGKPCKPCAACKIDSHHTLHHSTISLIC